MLTASRLREVLNYDPETGVFRWKMRRKLRVGTIAGTDHIKGYRSIVIDREFYLAHRLAWLYVHGEWPTEQIDHINLDKKDNRIANLRLATNAQNHANKPLQSNNTSGVKGVVWDKARSKWIAQIKVGGKNIHCGRYVDFDEACAVRAEAMQQYHGEFARME